MARQRDFAREYRQRVAKAEAEGRTRRSARGHGQTPSSPREALRNPLRYPRYVARHRAELDQLAADLGEPDVRQRGTLPGEAWAYGPQVLTGTDDSLPGYEFGGNYWSSIEAARQEIEESHAPPGIAVIVDRGPEFGHWRYEVWYARYPDRGHKRRVDRSTLARRRAQAKAA